MTRQPKPEFLNPDDFPEPHMEPVVRVSEAERLALEIDGERYGDVAAELRRLADVEWERNDYLQRLNNLHVNAQKCRAERDRLAAEVEALRQALMKAKTCALPTEVRDVVNAALRGAAGNAEIAALQADAERYRWLKWSGRGEWEVLHERNGWAVRYGVNELDAAIDAAKANAA